jgi:DNA ligase-1
LDGELWAGRGQFEETLSIVSRDRPHQGWGRVTYKVFEVPGAPEGLDARLELLRRYLEQQPVSHLKIIPQLVCRDVAHLEAQLELVESLGGEGLVLRNPETGYETGRTLNALKVKRFEDMEGVVVGYRPGKGKYTGMTGALWVEIAGGRRLHIGSGLSDGDRADPPPLGSVITFKHQGYTSSGIPRFASFLRVRKMP